LLLAIKIRVETVEEFKLRIAAIYTHES